MSWSKDKVERAREMAEPLTPRSEMSRKGLGSLLMSVMTNEGLCSAEAKCVRKDGHLGGCWPKGA